ncbi:MAG: hypothetical protein Fues2KO_14320 [Fuerstiella sp.]
MNLIKRLAALIGRKQDQQPAQLNAKTFRLKIVLHFPNPAEPTQLTEPVSATFSMSCYCGTLTVCKHADVRVGRPSMRCSCGEEIPAAHVAAAFRLMVAEVVRHMAKLNASN